MKAGRPFHINRHTMNPSPRAIPPAAAFPIRYRPRRRSVPSRNSAVCRWMLIPPKVMAAAEREKDNAGLAEKTEARSAAPPVTSEKAYNKAAGRRGRQRRRILPKAENRHTLPQTASISVVA